jgi:hypothetical protein
MTQFTPFAVTTYASSSKYFGSSASISSYYIDLYFYDLVTPFDK